MGYKYIDEKKEHLHTLNGKPLIGTSTAVGIISKPLTYWASGMAVGTLGWTATQADPDMRLEVATVALEGIKGLDGAEWLKRLDLAYKAHASNLKKTATAGTDMHEELEKYVRSCIDTNKGIPLAHSVNEVPQVSLFVDWSLKNVAQFIFSEGYCYSEGLWVGGIADAGAVLENGQMAIFDFKSAKEAYFGHFVQVAGYATQIEENGVLDKDGAQIEGKFKTDVLYVVPFGGDGVPKPRYDVADMINNFKSAVQLYKAQNNFGN